MRTKTLGRVALLLFSAACASACSSSAVGTGGDGAPSGDPSASYGPGYGAPTDDGSSGAPGTSGSGSGSQWDALFDAPESDVATPGSLFGTWAATSGSDELRLVLGAGSVMHARRCAGFGGAPPTTIGTSAKARVTESSIMPLEAKSVGAFPCEIAIHAVEIVACTDERFANCFELAGTSLVVWTDQEGRVEYTKLSDS